MQLQKDNFYHFATFFYTLAKNIIYQKAFFHNILFTIPLGFFLWAKL